MLAMLRRTWASGIGGSTWRSATSAKDLASSPRAAAWSQTAAPATSGPRSGWFGGASSSARRLKSAATPGSVGPTASAALSRVVIATSSPGSALAASCMATSTGSAPAASRTVAAWRSKARRTGTGTLARIASRVRSWTNASRPSRSTSTLLWRSSSTGSMSADGVSSSITATSLSENCRPSDAATVATRRTRSDARSRRRRMLSPRRSGSRSPTSCARPALTCTSASSRSPDTSSASRYGLPSARVAMRSSASSGSARRRSAVTWATAPLSKGRSVTFAPPRCSI